MHIASEQDIKAGRVTDVYFQRTAEVLRHFQIDKHVAMEVRATGLPREWPWAVLSGVSEVADLCRGIGCDVSCMDEGTVFGAGEPVLTISGPYLAFGVYETALLGLLCQASGVATVAARCRLAAGDRTLVSFGARRMHPAIAPMIERSAYLGGCDGVAVVMSAEMMGLAPVGTMPHALILVVGDAREAFRKFDQAMPAQVLRVCLVDTLNDEKFEALAAAEALGDKLYAVRLDTPGSRRGNMRLILREVRWELDLRGHQQVKLMVSGGLDEYNIPELNEYAQAYGVGTAISNAPTVNFAADIVEVEGKPFSKRGKESGRKNVLRCEQCGKRAVVPAQAPPTCACGGEGDLLLRPLIRQGQVVQELPGVDEIRQRVLRQLAGLTLQPSPAQEGRPAP